MSPSNVGAENGTGCAQGSVLTVRTEGKLFTGVEARLYGVEVVVCCKEGGGAVAATRTEGARCVACHITVCLTIKALVFIHTASFLPRPHSVFPPAGPPLPLLSLPSSPAPGSAPSLLHPHFLFLPVLPLPPSGLVRCASMSATWACPALSPRSTATWSSGEEGDRQPRRVWGAKGQI